MKRFTQLFCELDQSNRTNDKVAALARYFADVPATDAAWALYFLSGRTLPRAISSRHLWDWMAAESKLPAWLIAECYDAVGDMAETIALLLPNGGPGSMLPLSKLVDERLLPLRHLPDNSKRALLLQTWRELDPNERFVWNKLITGNFRIGAARTLVIRALAEVAHIDPAIMAHRVMGKWQPNAESFRQLLAPATADTTNSSAMPYPFFLASPLEMKIKRGEPLDDLGNVRDWQVEWKWDGIRAQLIRRSGETLLWSRGDEMITDSFPEIIEAGELLPDGTVLDGEILAWRGGSVQPFALLQRRLGRKSVGVKTRETYPVAFVAYDLLEMRGKDFRAEPLRERREQLENVLTEYSHAESNRLDKRSSVDHPLLPGLEDHPSSQAKVDREPILRLSPLLHADSWNALAEKQNQARSRGVEGLMLKKNDSAYGVGRQRGDWWKWKIDPFVIDTVLVAAQRGHGRRASLYTDYTFGLWDRGQLVPVAKAYSGLTDEEILQVDSFVRQNTTEKFGPVRKVLPAQVFELAFEGIQESSRHKSGVAVRFPRINRWRHDKKPEEADTLESLTTLAKGAKS